MSETVAPAAPAAAPSGVVASAASALAAACSFLTQKMFICRPDLLGLLRRSGAGDRWTEILRHSRGPSVIAVQESTM
jgi:hypothetical protein